MIIYNVTINIDDSVHEEWLNYMKELHIPDVMRTGCFDDYKMSRILNRQEDETGFSYAIQYRCTSMEKYEVYREKFAPALQQDVHNKFAGKFVAFRTLLEEIF